MNRAQKQKHFEESLERGLSFEHNVATPIIHSLYPLCSVRRAAKDPTDKNGPRAFSGAYGEIEIVLPDYEVYDPANNTRIWIDAKLKKKFYSNKKGYYLTIDTRAHKDYSFAMSTYFRHDELYLLFGVESEKKLYMAPWNPNPETIHFNNQYGNSDVPIYYKNQLIEIGTF